MTTRLLFWHKILLLLTISIITLTVCMVFVTWHFLNQASKEIGRDSEKILSEQSETFIEKLVKGQAATLDVQLAQAQAAAVFGAILLIEDIKHHQPEYAPIEKFLSDLYKQASYCSTAYFITSSGILWQYPKRDRELRLPRNFNIIKTPFFPKSDNFQHQTNKVVWSEVHINPMTVSFELVVDAVSPVWIEDVIYGYVGVSVSLTRLVAQFNQHQPIRGSYSFLIDTQRQLIGAPPHARVELSPAAAVSRGIISLHNPRNSELDMVLQKMVLGESALSKIMLNNEPKYVTYHPMRNINWRLGLVVPVRMATAASKQLINVVESGTRKVLIRMLYWAGGLLLLAMLGGIMLARHIASPIHSISAIVRDISDGNFSRRVNISTRDETGALGVAFNAMADKIQYMMSDLNRINKELHLSNEELTDEIKERQRIEKALKESEERFRSLSENSPDIIFTLEYDGAFAYMNPAFKKILGYERETTLGKYFTDFIKEDDRGNHIRLFKKIRDKKEIIRDMVTTLMHKNGEFRIFCISIAPNIDSVGNVTGMIGICKDVTAQRELEAQLRQSQKMEALGTLAGGIAHDFNNILAAIMGYTELAQMKLSNDNPARSNLENVLKATHRAKNLVRQILTFSRQSEHEQEPLQIRLIIKETLKLLRASIPVAIEIHQDIDIESDTVLADPTQIHQVMMNLCTNSAYAMREKGGILEVSLSNVYIDPELALHQASTLRPGEYVRLTVSDTGHGIEPKIISRIFDPFFTTKRIGEGTGMGLSVVHGIVKSHGGNITVESEPGIGTTFHVYLPLMESKEEILVDDTELTELLLMGKERILFIDDEKELAEAFKGMLEHLGYDVTIRTDSIDALALLLEQPDRFDLVITDQSMPNIRGSELTREILRIRPDLPFILCTGSSEHITRDEAIGSGFKDFFMKPVAIQDIARAMREILEK